MDAPERRERAHAAPVAVKTAATRAPHGFAAWDPDKRRQVASRGGKAAHAKGTAHKFTPDEAQRAGRKGGEVVSSDRSHMSRIGRQGGEAVAADREHMRQIGQRGGEAIAEDREHMAQIGSRGGKSIRMRRAAGRPEEEKR
jgi:general stress protein YciG